MERLLLKGRNSTFKNHKGTDNIPIEQKKHMLEDSSWSSYGIPGIIRDTTLCDTGFLLEEQKKNIYQNHVERKDTLTSEQIMLKVLGCPTDDLTRELLYAESYHKVDSAIRAKHGSKHWIERCSPLNTLNFGKRTPMAFQTNEDLIERAFLTLTILPAFSKYGKAIRDHFVRNDGTDLVHKTEISHITDINTKKNILLKNIHDKVVESYKLNNGIYSPVDVSGILKEYMLDFSKSFFDTSEMLAIGGVQQIEIEGYLLKEKQNKGWPSYNDLEIELRMTIKDWFGVDEDDITKNAPATYVDREGLAALWILQHQRGYKPFINVFTYKNTIHVIFENNK